MTSYALCLYFYPKLESKPHKEGTELSNLYMSNIFLGIVKISADIEH